MKTHPLKKYRDENGISQGDLAVAVGATRWTINRIEAGERNPSIDLCKRLEAVTGIHRQKLRPDLFDGVSLTDFHSPICEQAK